MFLQKLFQRNKSKDKEEIMYIIVGLGNPEKKYDGTRHNIGFRTIDALAEQYNITFQDKKHKGMCGVGVIEGVKVMLIKPLTYMNRSGECVAEAVNYYKLDPEEDLLIIYDDISLAPGNIRIRKKGSAGGHNGIKSIIAQTGTQNFNRVKVGVGEKPKGWDLADYVMGHFSADDEVYMKAAIADAVEATRMIIGGQIDQAMNNYNGKKVER